MNQKMYERWILEIGSQEYGKDLPKFLMDYGVKNVLQHN